LDNFQLVTLDKVCAAGGDVNEDGFFSSSKRAWLLDGASGLSDRQLLDTDSDARWLVNKALGVISQFEDEPFPSQPKILAKQLNKDYLLEVSDDDVEQFERPSASLIAAEIQGNQLLYGQLGDCSAIFQASPNSTVFSTPVGPLANLDSVVLEKLKGLRANGNLPLHIARKNILEDLRANRSKVNLPAGYSALTVGPNSQFVFEPKSISVGEGSVCLLMSDGFSRLIDTFHVYTKESLLESAVKSGLAQLLAELRDLENQDPEALEFTRFKRHDDASALLLLATEQ
jgi:hypothetical protein